MFLTKWHMQTVQTQIQLVWSGTTLFAIVLKYFEKQLRKKQIFGTKVQIKVFEILEHFPSLSRTFPKSLDVMKF